MTAARARPSRGCAARRGVDALSTALRPLFFNYSNYIIILYACRFPNSCPGSVREVRWCGQSFFAVGGYADTINAWVTPAGGKATTP
jgi:hypothetical protein